MSIKQQIENHGPETNQPQNIRELSHGHPICRRFRLRVNTITTMLLHLAYLAPRHISAQTAVHLSTRASSWIDRKFKPPLDTNIAGLFLLTPKYVAKSPVPGCQHRYQSLQLPAPKGLHSDGRATSCRRQRGQEAHLPASSLLLRCRVTAPLVT